MTYTAQIKVMPLTDLLDPQGKAVMGGLNNLGLKGVQDVRIGRHIDLKIEASDDQAARLIAEEAAGKLLANPVMEMYEITISKLAN
ncbi:MAG: phosphoribosylformylglycinamidine synthase subunit PurS [Ferruginibacter sp.]